MSYSITPDQRVLKDGEDVGFIRDGICYTDIPPKGRGIASFRSMAGNPDLQFKPLPAGAQWDALMAETRRKESVSQANNPIFSGDPERFTETISSKAASITMNWQPGIIPQDAEVLHSPPAIPEPPKSPVLGDRDPEWQRWFIATHGEAAFKAKWPTRKLP